MLASVNEWHAHTEFVRSTSTFFKTPYKSPGLLFGPGVSTRVLSPSHCLFVMCFFFLSPKQWLEFKEESLWTSQDDKTEIFWCAAQLNQCQLCLQPRQRVGVAFHIIWARGAFEAALLRLVNDNRGRKSLLAAPEHIQRLVLFLCWLIDWYNTCRTSSGKPVQYFLWRPVCKPLSWAASMKYVSEC